MDKKFFQIFSVITLLSVTYSDPGAAQPWGGRECIDLCDALYPCMQNDPTEACRKAWRACASCCGGDQWGKQSAHMCGWHCWSIYPCMDNLQNETTSCKTSYNLCYQCCLRQE